MLKERGKIRKVLLLESRSGGSIRNFEGVYEGSTCTHEVDAAIIEATIKRIIAEVISERTRFHLGGRDREANLRRPLTDSLYPILRYINELEQLTRLSSGRRGVA